MKKNKMTFNILKTFSLGASLWLLIFVGVYAQKQSSQQTSSKNFDTLDAITFTENSVVFKLSDGKAKFNAFKISNPLRIVVDFTGVEHNLKTKETLLPSEVKNDVVSKVRSGQFQNEPLKIARAVIELKKDTGYEVKSLAQGKEVAVYFKDITDVKQATSPATTTVTATSTAISSSGATPISSPAPTQLSTKSPKPIEVIAVPIEEESVSSSTLTSTPKSTANLESKTVSPTAPSTTKEVTPSTSLPQSTTSKSAATPKVTTPTSPSPTTKETKTSSPASTPSKKEEPRVSKTVLPKTLVSFDFQEADIRDVLRVLSAQSGVNIIYGADVAGVVTITLKNVPFDQAFNTILTLNNLVSQDLGSNIIRVMTPQVLAQERTQAVTFTKIFPLNYAKAEDVKTQLDAIRSAEGRKGIITVDSRTNTLIITDTQEGLDNAARLIAEIDKKPYQVLIEAKIVEVNLDKKLDLGINWSYARTNVSDSETQYVGKTQATVGGASGLYYGMPSGASSIEETGPTGGGTGVNFPASPVSGQLSGISFGLISDNVRLNAMLSMLASKGLTKLLSNPKVTTLNNQEAKILVGERVPYVQQTTQLGTASGGVSSEIQWLEVGIKLTVTPTINADKQITLKVYPQVSLLSRVTAAGPVVGTREAETTVMIKDNETVVIGGLIREEDIKSAAQVPLLGDIPILGQLFRRKYDSKERSELLVFITPQIIASDE